MGVELRDMGTTGDYAPQLKRGAHRLSDGRTAVVVPDTNRSDGAGDDVTGVAKIFVYLSNADRTVFTQEIAYTPAVAPSSSTKAFVGSSCVRENNTLFVVYQGTDNSLRMITWSWTGSTWGAGTEQTVIAANAVTNRFRAVDMDALSTNANLGVIVYESLASSGVGAYVRVYIRLADGTTWRKAWETQIFTSETINMGSEDVSIGWDRGGAVANVGTLAIYYTRRHTLADFGDSARELSFNVSSGTDNSATLVGSWYTNLSQNIASKSHRGWIFSEANDQWVLATSIGTTAPYFMAIRLYHNTFTGMVENRTSVGIQFYRDRRFIIQPFVNQRSYVNAEFCDGRVVFCFAGLGWTSGKIARGIVIALDKNNLTNKSALYIDSVARIWDQGSDLGFSYVDAGVLAIAGGGNKNQNSFNSYNFMVMYGFTGNVANNTRKARTAFDDTLSAPLIISPKSNPAVDTPQLVANMQNLSPYTNARGKLHWQFATDFGFTADLREVIQADTEFQTYSSTDGLSRPSRTISLQLPSAQALFGEFWFVRVRMMDDLGGVSPWSIIQDWTLSHPPVALPLNPSDNSTYPWTTGDTLFRWSFTDAEPTDSQTAYQVIVKRVDTGATVHDTGKVISGDNFVVIDIVSTLRNVQLQWQVALWDEDDNQGVFSNPFLFTVLNKPIALITAPADGAVIATAIPTVSWTFTADAGRTQRAFRVIVYDTDQDPDAIVGDSGWTVSSDTSYTFPSVILQNLTDYRVVVEVQDSTGMYGSSESNLVDNSTFEQNVLGWTPTNGTIAKSNTFAHSGDYSMRLTPTGALTATVAADMFPAVVGEEYVGSIWLYMPAGFAGNTTVFIDWYDSAAVLLSSSSTVYPTITAGTWTNISTTGTAPASTVFAAIRVTFASSITAGDLAYFDDALVKHDDQNFSTSYTVPVGATASLTSDNFKVTVAWTNAAIDPDFVSWRVYRRYLKPASTDLDIDNTANTWYLIYETEANQANYTFNDYLMPFRKNVDYVVVQMVDRFGALIESDISSFSTVNVQGDRYYFIPEIPIGTIASFEASSITGDGFTHEVEQQTIHVIQRGRQVQIGDDLGYAGSMSIQLRNPATVRLEREFLEYLSTPNSGNVYIKSPFGDVLYVAIGSVSAQRIAGVGSVDMVDLTVPYSEVFGETVITRVT